MRNRKDVYKSQIYNRTTLDADAATVGLYLVVGTYGACLYIEVKDVYKRQVLGRER